MGFASHRLLAAAVLALALASTSGGSRVASAESDEAGGTRQDELYKKGTASLDDGKYEPALQAFTEAAGLSGGRTDGALYWKAYAESKLGKRAEAAATLADLKKRFPKSRWLKDAAALEVEMRGPGTSEAAEGAVDDDLKLIAINSLMGSDPERALPLLEKLLAGKSSADLKERALFVLTQSESPRARAIVVDIARGRRSPELQERAIQDLGMMEGGKENMDLLAEIYASTPSTQIKESVMNAYAMAGEGERLGRLAKGEKNPALRIEAIRKLGMVEGSNTTLVALYKADKDPEVREAALQGLAMADDAHSLVELARAEKDRAMKARIVQQLSILDSKEARDYMLELLR